MSPLVLSIQVTGTVVAFLLMLVALSPLSPQRRALQACWALVSEEKGRSFLTSHAERGAWVGWGYDVGPQRAPGWEGSGTHRSCLGHIHRTTDKLEAPQGSDKAGSAEHRGTGTP